MFRYLIDKSKARLALLLLFHTLRIFGTIGVALLINYLIDSVSLAISSGQTSVLIRCAVLCCVYALILGLVIFWHEKSQAGWIKSVMLQIRAGLLEGVLNKNISERQKTNSAEYLTLFNQNLTLFEQNYLKNLLSIYESLAGILIAVGLLVYIHPMAAAISIFAMAIPSLIPKLFGGRLGRQQADIMQCAADYTMRIKNILNGYEVIKAYQLKDTMRRKHKEDAEKLEQSKVLSAGTMAGLYGLVNAASVSVQFFIMTLCGVLAVGGSITIGSVIAVTQLTGQVISPAFQLSAKFSQLKSVRPICGQIQDLLQFSQHPEEEIRQKEMKHWMKLEDLSFSYQDNPVIKHVQAQFDFGKKYAIVGRSGSGKSTLLKILAGYYRDYTGRVEIDGAGDLFCSLALISQDIFLFDDTVRNNITLYREYPEAQIDEAIRMAGLKETIDCLEKGLDTSVEENGSRFSGGEKQRIAIARAFLYHKSLLLLDEATSSLDNECARKIEESIFGLENMTCVAVTHDLYSDTMKKYDKIFVMEDGRIVEQGTFEELSGRSGVFRNLYAAGVSV